MKSKYDEWNKNQEELFELFFKQQTKETINFKTLTDSINPVHDVWHGLYKILEENFEYFDKYSTIEKIKKVTHKNKEYLILKLELWYYIIIDLETKKTLKEEEITNRFKEDFFIYNFKEKRTDKFNVFYHFDECSLECSEKLIEYYNEYKNILSEEKEIEYRIMDEESIVSISLEISKFRIILGFNRFGSHKNANYVFINKELNATGASNPTGNNEMLVKMGNRVCEIEVPKSLIPEYILKMIINTQEQTKDKIISYTN